MRLDPTNAQAWSIRGLILSQSNKTSATVAAYERALELNPNDANTMVWLSQQLATSGLYNDSRRRIEQAFQLDPRNAYVRGRYAAALAQTGEPASIRRALAIVEESIALSPDNARALTDAADVTLLVGDVVKGAQYIVDAVALRPGAYNLGGQLIPLFAIVGDDATARRWGEFLDSLTPDTVHGSWAMLVTDFELFAEFAETYIERHPTDAYALNNVAVAAALSGDYGQAIELLERDLENWRGARYQGHPSAAELVDLGMLVWLYEETGDPARAQLHREAMRPIYRDLVEQGRPPGINGMLMETGYHLASGDPEAAVRALREGSTTTERSLFPIWSKFPWFAEFAARDDVQRLFQEWETERDALAARLRAEAPAEIYDPDALFD